MMNRVLSKNIKRGEGIVLFNTFPYIIKILLLLLLISFISLNFIPIKVLLASDFRTGEYLSSWRISEGENFTVVYTHSVELTEVSEIYVIENGKIKLTDTYFKSYGAGLPANTPYKFEITNDGFRIYDINQVLESLVYRTGAVRANHSLLINGEKHMFLDFSQPREGVKLECDNISAFKYITREDLK
ncbi:DUF1850 domain-containing protein [Tissierella sp. Yu-01]|uniref:DUF1850 domain-containing protein n=1 Tax=Tissierella sp. Yu-01 TaxID=3035694 RepID=UPI00240E762E|nr:DUF1850 domain-containing protein [Tissierella sp. Yu-01]WFA08388.1 DUF1850 domain-containing protein [Tissierella sp. Yu-01]